jgi:hypothetical protein
MNLRLSDALIIAIGITLAQLFDAIGSLLVKLVHQ